MSNPKPSTSNPTPSEIADSRLHSEVQDGKQIDLGKETSKNPSTSQPGPAGNQPDIQQDIGNQPSTSQSAEAGQNVKSLDSARDDVRGDILPEPQAEASRNDPQEVGNPDHGTESAVEEASEPRFLDALCECLRKFCRCDDPAATSNEQISGTASGPPVSSDLSPTVPSSSGIDSSNYKPFSVNEPASDTTPSASNVPRHDPLSLQSSNISGKHSSRLVDTSIDETVESLTESTIRNPSPEISSEEELPKEGEDKKELLEESEDKELSTEGKLPTESEDKEFPKEGEKELSKESEDKN